MEGMNKKNKVEGGVGGKLGRAGAHRSQLA